MDSDRVWQALGNEEPYFAVLTNPEFRSGEIDQAARERFFGTGRDHVQRVVASLGAIGFDCRGIKSALDFGCGVGRILIYLAEYAERVDGADVAPAMLAEASRVCVEFGVGNARLLCTDDSLSQLAGAYDLVHTYIVLQHIDVARGVPLIGSLVDRVAVGGAIALHVTYAKRRFDDRLGVPPPELMRKELAKSPPLTMQMNAYPLNEIFYLLQRAGFVSLRVEFVDHGGELGVFIFGIRNASDASVNGPL